MTKVKHLLGISGGKDSAALAIYMKDRHPELDIEYYTCDTGRELEETYLLIDRLNSKLGKDIELYSAIDELNTPEESSFDHFLAMYGGYLPSSTSRWCTKKLKLDPFEQHIGNEPTISYVGIRGDEDRDGFISTKETIQSIFPFRKNIWSEDVIKKVLDNTRINEIIQYYKEVSPDNKIESLLIYVKEPISESFTRKQKLLTLLDLDTIIFNKVVFKYLKTTNYPVGMLDYFPLVENDDILVRKDIFKVLEDSGVGVPEYYLPLEYEVEIDGEIKKGTYSRSRSGCFFCFFQQKIEWVWLLETHPDLFKKAMSYEKEGYTWAEESLTDLRKAERVTQIKRNHYLKAEKNKLKNNSNKNWQDSIIEAEGEGCDSCFI